MLCAISGQPPEEAVVSAKSGLVFEKRLVEKYLAVNGKCPVTGDPLLPTDLIPLKGYNKAVKPRVATTTSIPSMLQLFQSEWDALMLESFTLKQQLDSARQELAQSLYRNDAACRVIARLTKERDEARKMLAEMKLPAGAIQQQPEDAAMEASKEEPMPALSDDVLQKITAKSQELSKDRRKRAVAETLAKPEALKEYAARGSYPVHKASAPGITCIDARQQRRQGVDDALVATGGNDGDVVLLSSARGVVAATLSGHTKRVTAVRLHPAERMAFSASSDRTVRVWSQQGSEESAWEATHVLKGHTAEVTSVSVHATGEYVASASADRSWAAWDVRTGAMVARARADDAAPLRCASFHPDGLLLATAGVDSVVRVWELKAKPAVVASFEGHKGAVNSLAFSENGYFLVSGSDDGTAKLWDLRKLKNIQTLSPTTDTSRPVSSVAFDWSGQYLAATAGSEVAVYHGSKQFTPLCLFKEHTMDVTGVSFGPDASFVATSSLDRHVKIFSTPSTDMDT